MPTKPTGDPGFGSHPLELSYTPPSLFFSLNSVFFLYCFIMLNAHFFVAFKTGAFKAIHCPLSTTLVASHKY